ncbi:MAG: hypothetical protein FWG10_04275 [Eubacteriaceae bacterium]|nr:hypothetical protein [Eubacteriaceae bacterium]
MTLKDFFIKFDLKKLKIGFKFAGMEITFIDSDKDAAWDMYIELITRVAVQKLPEDSGDEKTALDSVYSLFATTRTILKQYGRSAQQFSKIAVIVLNQIIRPFTAKWHKISLEEGNMLGADFRNELESLQVDLLNYARLLATIADVEDISEIAIA